MQDKFMKRIKQLIPEERSVIDEIAAILNMSYDAAYRRSTNKATLSLAEAVKLAKHFKISLNKLYEVGEQNTLLAEKSPTIIDTASLENYFKASLKNMAPLTKLKDVSIIYSAKDIPIFYTLQDSLITKYKCYVWLKFLNEDGSMSKVSFEEFLETIPESLLEHARKLSVAYKNINITEFWNDNTINGTLQQIFYYFESGLVSKKIALLICDDIAAIIDHVEQQTIQQTIIKSNNNATYHLYKSDLLTMSNTMMIKTQHQKVFFTPFTVLSYLKIEHSPTCEDLSRFFEKQKKNSKLLVNAGEKDRALFFNMLQQKVKTVKKRITLNQDLMFF